MENKNMKIENSTLKKIGIAAAVILVLVIAAVNIYGGGTKGTVAKAYKTAFADEKSITESLETTFRKDFAVNKLMKKRSLAEISGEVVSVGGSDNKLLNSIMQRASFESVINKDVEKKLSSNETIIKFNDKELLTADFYTSPGGITVTVPQVQENSFLIKDDSVPAAEALSYIYTMDHDFITDMGNKAADYFVTLLKFGTYETMDNGHILYYIEEEDMDEAVEFMKSLLGYKAASMKSFPIDINTVSVNGLKSEIVLNDDKSLKESEMSCEVIYGLKDDPENTRTAVASISFLRENGMDVKVSVKFENETQVGLKLSRVFDGNRHDITADIFYANGEETTDIILNKALCLEGEFDRTLSIKMLKGEGENSEGYEIRRSDLIEPNEDGSLIIITSPEAEILKHSGDETSGVLKVSLNEELKAGTDEIVIPDSVDASSLTGEEIGRMLFDIVIKMAKNALIPF